MYIYQTIFLIVILGTSSAFEQACQNIFISTDISSNAYDVVDKGNISDRWVSGSQKPVLTQGSAQVDFFYVTLMNSKIGLSNDTIQVNFDDQYFADSSAYIDDFQQLGSGKIRYAVAVQYRCKQYGGGLINYSMDFNVPDCGHTKICGDPMLARDSFTMDISFKKFNKTIVRNGFPIEPAYWDSDVGETKIPQNQDHVKFYTYMQKINPNNPRTFPNNTQQQAPGEFQMLRDILMLIPSEKVSAPQMISDQMEVQTEILTYGDIALTGQITEIPSLVEIKFLCQKPGLFKVQFTLPLIYFKDINLFFQKECPVETFVDEIEHEIAILFIITVIIMAGCLVTTIFNTFFRGIKGIDAVPFGRSILKCFLSFDIINTSKIGGYLNSFLEVEYIKPIGQSQGTDQKMKDLDNQKEEQSSGYGGL